MLPSFTNSVSILHFGFVSFSGSLEIILRNSLWMENEWLAKRCLGLCILHIIKCSSVMLISFHIFFHDKIKQIYQHTYLTVTASGWNGSNFILIPLTNFKEVPLRAAMLVQINSSNDNRLRHLGDGFFSIYKGGRNFFGRKLSTPNRLIRHELYK